MGKKGVKAGNGRLDWSDFGPSGGEGTGEVTAEVPGTIGSSLLGQMDPLPHPVAKGNRVSKTFVPSHNLNCARTMAPGRLGRGGGRQVGRHRIFVRHLAILNSL